MDNKLAILETKVKNNDPDWIAARLQIGKIKTDAENLKLLRLLERAIDREQGSLTWGENSVINAAVAVKTRSSITAGRGSKNAPNNFI